MSPLSIANQEIILKTDKLVTPSGDYSELSELKLSLSVLQRVMSPNLDAERELCANSLLDAYQRGSATVKDGHPDFGMQVDPENIIDYFTNQLCQKELTLFMKGTVILVRATIDKKPVGWVTYEVDARELEAFYVRILVVDPEYQSMGIGRHLLFAIRNDPALYPHTQALYLRARALNKKALSFYERLNFKEIGYSDPSYSSTDKSLKTLRWKVSP